ncbi:IS3 family transposase [Mesomycoplasma hyorhinis]|uniref:IS3 family transposase n=2 Tax=Mesomycoplasma hyorhinis TaxID=2100 RepID=UPI001C03FAEB|nr:IS3 family transposase [Mesomycoplasma hyorhinis]
MKYSLEFKLECVKKYKKGIEIKKPDFANTSQKNFLNQVYFWEKIYDKLGVEGLKKKPRNKKWTIEQRLNIVKRFLAGEPIVKISLENNLNPSQISFWAKKYLESGISGLELNKGRPIMKSKINNNKSTKVSNNSDSQDQSNSSLSVYEELKLLREENKLLKKENEVLKKWKALVEIFDSNQPRQEKIKKIYNRVKADKNLQLTQVLKEFSIPISTFYYELKKEDFDKKNEEIISQMKLIFKENKARYGKRRIKAELNNRDYKIGFKKVRRLMKKFNLKAICSRRKYKSYKGTVGKIADNILNRNFVATQPNQKWTTDVTEFSGPFGKAYLSPILDMFNGEVIAWDLSTSANNQQIRKMLQRAFSKHKNLEGLIFHSDQGWQYQHRQFSEKLKQKGIIQSMSPKGNCLDNSVIESFFGTLKRECFYGCEKEFLTFKQLHKAIANYIYYYNHKRIKDKIKWMFPIKFRETFIPNYN